MLRIINVSAGYGALRVLDGISLRVEPGEVIALLGGNGAGKSTLLKTMAGVLPPLEGRILLQGKEVTGAPAERMAAAGLTLVPEGRGLFPRLTVLENLRLGGYVRRLTGAALAERIEQAVTLFPILAERRQQHAGSLSGGQQQMLAIAKALIGSPQILLLDEPSTGLAPKLVADVFAKVQLLKETGMTILLAEQHVQHALQIADRAYVLENGRITLSGPAETLLASHDVQRAYLGM